MAWVDIPLSIRDEDSGATEDLWTKYHDNHERLYEIPLAMWTPESANSSGGTIRLLTTYFNIPQAAVSTGGNPRLSLACEMQQLSNSQYEAVECRLFAPGADPQTPDETVVVTGPFTNFPYIFHEFLFSTEVTRQAALWSQQGWNRTIPFPDTVFPFQPGVICQFWAIDVTGSPASIVRGRVTGGRCKVLL